MVNDDSTKLVTFFLSESYYNIPMLPYYVLLTCQFIFQNGTDQNKSLRCDN